MVNQQPGDSDAKAQELSKKGWELVNDGLWKASELKIEQALNCYQQALAIFQEIGDRKGEGKSLNGMGSLYHRLRQYEQALDCFRQALASFQEIRDLAGECLILNNIGIVYSTLSQDNLAIESYQQALAIQQKIGGRNWEEEEKILYRIGEAYLKCKRYEQAVEFYQQALALVINQESDYRDIRDKEATYLNNISNIYSILGQNEQALEFYQRVLAIARNRGDRAKEGAWLHQLGRVYCEQKRYEQSLEVYQQALAIYQKIGDRTEEMQIFQNIGLIYVNDLQRYDRALNCYQQALAICQEIGHVVGEAESLKCMGLIYKALGQYERALNFYQQALAIFQEIGDREGEGKSLNGMGLLYQWLGQYEQALDCSRQALAIFQKIRDLAWEYLTLNNIGVVYSSLNQDDLAIEFYQQALAIQQQIGNRNNERGTLNSIAVTCLNLGLYAQEFKQLWHTTIISQEIGNWNSEGTLMCNMGIANYAQGHYAPALDYYQRSLAIHQELKDREGEAAMLFKIGRLYRYAGQFGYAINFLQQALAIIQKIGNPTAEETVLAEISYLYKGHGDKTQAINFLKQAIEVNESIQGALKIEELKASFAGEQIETYERLMNLLWNETRFEETFYYMERARARAFIDQLANGPINFRTGANAKLLQQEETLKSQISALHTQLGQLLKQERRLQHQIRAVYTQLVTLRSHPSNELDTEAICALQKHLSKLEKDYTKLLTQLKLQSPDVASLVTVDVASLDEIQGLLDPDTTLIEYFVTQEVTITFIITCQHFGFFTLNVSREDLTKKIEAFRRFANLKNSHPDSLKQLHEWLIAPLLLQLTTNKLAIVPHGVLHYLPFAALTDGQRYLNDDYTISILPNASILRFLPAKRKPSTDTILILGNPTTVEPLPPLHFASLEAQAIANLYGTQALVGADATESVVLTQSGEAEILHIAAHGRYNPHNPLFSTLFLAPDAQHNGRLEVHDIYGLDLTTATNLVVLSACQTQMGTLSKGDEVVGLNRAFLYAGTPSVMASLWSVNDKVTALLMQRFYTHLRAGMTKAEALRIAQIEVRSEYPHPYYWAAFMLTGDSG